jgi:lysophospholipase L1-like esterase
MSQDRAGRFLRLGLFAAGVAVAAVAAYFCIEQTPKLVFLKVALALAIGLEAAYAVTLVVCLAAAPVLLAILVRGRRRGVRRPRLARGLLLCVSVVFALALCEGASAVVRARRERASAVPAGGFARGAAKGVTLPDATDPVVLPTEFPEPKGPHDLDIVVLGESSAAGVPYNLFSLSPGAIVKWRIEQEVPGRVVHLNVLADSGDTLEGQHRKLASLKRKPDVIMVYCGHNEFSARLPESRDLDYYVDAAEPTRWERAVARVEAASPLCGLLRQAADTCRVAIPPPANGNRQLVDAPAYRPEEYDALLADFRRRLEAIVVYAESVGAWPILVAPPGNDAGFEPSRSYLPPSTRRAERDAFAAEVAAARRLESSDPDAAARAYRTLIDRQPGFAECHFRLARLLEQAGVFDDAYAHYVLARDLDGMPMRCLTSFQDVYRKLAGRGRCALIDGQAYFHAIGPHGLLDDHLFHDGMHPSLRGQAALAQAMLRALRSRASIGWPDGAPEPAVDPVAVARRFAIGKHAWNKICHWGIMFYDRTAPARYDPSERRARQDAFGKAADKIAAGRSPESVGLPNIGVTGGPIRPGT